MRLREKARLALFFVHPRHLTFRRQRLVSVLRETVSVGTGLTWTIVLSL